MEVPGVLSILATHDIDGYVPGIQDLLNGYTDHNGITYPSAEEKIEKGKLALNAFKEYRTLKDTDPTKAAEARQVLDETLRYQFCRRYCYGHHPRIRIRHQLE